MVDSLPEEAQDALKRGLAQKGQIEAIEKKLSSGDLSQEKRKELDEQRKILAKKSEENMNAAYNLSVY